MKRTCATLTVLAALAATACADLCDKCKDMMYTMDIGQCGFCGGETGSGAFKFCKACSAKFGVCEHCGELLKPAAQEPKPEEKPAPPGQEPATKIDAAKAGTYKSGKWEYRYAPAGRARKGASGELLYDGKAVHSDGVRVNDFHVTPWGRLFWVGPRGWLPGPVGAKAGRLLLSPQTRPAKALMLTKADNGKTVEPMVGQEIVLRLAGNPTTGYSWAAKALEGKAIRPVGQVKYEQDAGQAGRVGAGGTFEFRFQAVAEGSATISMVYARPWEKDKPPAETFKVSLAVKENPAAARANELTAQIKTFGLRLVYHGEQDKPYQSLTLTVPPIQTLRHDPFHPIAVISEEQARKIIDHLAAEGFLAEAADGRGKTFKLPTGPAYVMSVGAGEIELNQDLGWGLNMLTRLDALRTVLDGKAAEEMTRLLARMSGHRRQWESPRR